MCGIVGYVSFRPLDLDLQPALDMLQHRGPDGCGIISLADGRIQFGHTRLSIIGLGEEGRQPAVGSDGSAITYNGEIYNYLELAGMLRAEGIQVDSSCDTLVLHKFISVYGFKKLVELNGMFGFAYYDPNTKATSIVRDRYGIKPLYYLSKDGTVYFASEAKALWCLVEMPSGLDVTAIARYNTFLWNSGDDLPIKGIKKVPPGCMIEVDSAGKITIQSWYTRRTTTQQKNNGSPANFVSQAEIYLRQAVQRQMVSDVEVGAFLSGGVDSSAIVAFASEINPDIRCFTIDSGTSTEGFSEDLPYARKVAKHLGVNLDVITVDHQNLWDDIEQMIFSLDEPLADPAPLNVLYISQLAKQSGIKVLLSGAGGDDIFSGYRRHLAVSVDRYLEYLPSSVRAGFARLLDLSSNRSAAGRRLSRFSQGLDLNGDDRLVNYFAWLPSNVLEGLFNPEFKYAVAKARVFEPFHSYLQNISPETDRLTKMLFLEQRFFLSDHNLNYTDKMSMAAGVEVRVPFLDNDLVDFSYTVPSKLKQSGREGKWVLKEAMRPFLPNEVLFRPKSGFGAPLRSWLRNELRAVVAEVLSKSSIDARGIFHYPAVKALVDADHAGKGDYSYTIFSLVCFEVWARKFIDQADRFCSSKVII